LSTRQERHRNQRRDLSSFHAGAKDKSRCDCVCREHDASGGNGMNVLDVSVHEAQHDGEAPFLHEEPFARDYPASRHNPEGPRANTEDDGDKLKREISRLLKKENRQSAKCAKNILSG